MARQVMYGAGPDGKSWWIRGGRDHELEALAADLLQKLFDREEEHNLELKRAWDRGWYEHAGQVERQKQEPGWPITMANPYWIN